MLLDRWKRRVA